ncbi:hypothetical protein BT93_D1367 [Corymbia citriodora subsp. variegata]|nr:hypothetical protein BT93_D1367 [Corymbia citriodora subsp. variegata]
MTAVAKIEGVTSITIDIEKATLEIIGNVDPVCIVLSLRKKCGICVEIVSVGPEKPPEKEKEPEEKEPKCPKPCLSICNPPCPKCPEPCHSKCNPPCSKCPEPCLSKCTPPPPQCTPPPPKCPPRCLPPPCPQPCSPPPCQGPPPCSLNPCPPRHCDYNGNPCPFL